MGYCLKTLRITLKQITVFLLISLFSIQMILPPAALAWGEFTYKDEMELGKKFSVLVKSQMPLVQDPEVTNYINGLVTKLSSGMPPQPFPFQSNVVMHPSVNAFATPGGYLFVYTGLILTMEHESELAAVMSHEMAHVTQRHIARRVESSQYISILSVIGMLAGALIGGDAGAGLATGSMAAGQSAMLNYSRADEREADQVGMNFLVAAGYPPQGMVGAFQKMSRRQWMMGTNIPTYLSTHPGLQERISDMSMRIERLPKDKRITQWDDSKFFRIQTIVRARYSDIGPATTFFTKELNGSHKSLALMGLAILASRKNSVADATKLFDDALALAPNDELITREAGRFHYLKGNKAKGMELLAKAVSMDRNDLMASFYYARGLADSGQTTLAITHMKTLLRSVPEDSEIHFYLARYYGESKDMFKANLHMAYSHLYENEKRKIEQFHDKAKSLATTPQQKAELERFENELKERRQFWK